MLCVRKQNVIRIASDLPQWPFVGVNEQKNSPLVKNQDDSRNLNLLDNDVAVTQHWLTDWPFQRWSGSTAVYEINPLINRENETKRDEMRVLKHLIRVLLPYLARPRQIFDQ